MFVGLPVIAEVIEVIVSLVAASAALKSLAETFKSLRLESSYTKKNKEQVDLVNAELSLRLSNEEIKDTLAKLQEALKKKTAGELEVIRISEELSRKVAKAEAREQNES